MVSVVYCYKIDRYQTVIRPFYYHGYQIQQITSLIIGQIGTSTGQEFQYSFKLFPDDADHFATKKKKKHA